MLGEDGEERSQIVQDEGRSEVGRDPCRGLRS